MNEKPSIVAVDTETYKGYATLLVASSPNDTLEVLYHSDLSKLSSVECFDWLMNVIRKRVPGHVAGFFFNISFDTNAMLKEHFMNVLVEKEDQKKFVDSHKLELDGNDIYYVPNKSISINNNKRYFHFYDVGNFVRDTNGKGTLEETSQAFLGCGKLSDFSNDDKARLNTDKTFWKQNIDQIVEYCKRDAMLTAKLGNVVVESIHDEYGFWLDRLNSNASIIKAWFAKNHPEIRSNFIKAAKSPLGWFSPLGLNESQMKIICRSYYGGMFDTWRFGRVKGVKKRDIVSAYPYEISKLPRLDTCKVVSSTNIESNVVAGFFKIKMQYTDRVPMPFRYDQRVAFPKMEETYYTEDKNIFPTSDDERTQYVTLDTLLYLLSKQVDLEIVDSVQFVGNFIPAFPDYVNLFNKRQQYKQKRDSCKEASKEYRFWNTKQYFTKIAMNAGYGMFAEQLHGATQFTNMAYASMITANCRLKILQAIDVVEKENVVSIATDSLQFTGSNDLPLGEKLGDWSKEFDDMEVITYQNGISLSRRGNENWNLKGRGIPSKALEPEAFLSAKGSVLKYEVVRPIRLLPALISNKSPQTISNINIFQPIQKSIDLADNSLKRDVDVYEFEDYNRGEVDSRPLDLLMFSYLRCKELVHSFVDIPKVRNSW